MKKIAILAIMATLCMGTVNAQSFLSNILGKLKGSSSTETTTSTENVVTNVLGSLLGNSVTLSKSAIKGTWEYTGASCVLESDNALAQIGGSVATSKIEEKMNTYLKKIGVKEGTCSFTFAENDTCTFKVGSREIKGKYTLDGENKTIQFSFLQGHFTSTAHVAYSVSSLSIVFNADKMLNLIQKVTPTAAKYSTTIATLSTLLENYKGMMLGMKLKK
ncbi:MAG: DUF4923 family protein [Bacteroidaceae bacterium]|nr:DUF4923 family protein [Bacteroidaceae bacterium]